VIIDSKGSKSRQQDIILVDAGFPTISVGGEREALVIAESVIATIEVKTNLTAAELQSTLEAVTVTKRLFRSGELCYSKRGAEMRFPPHPILSYVFAFDGATLDTLTRVMFDYCTEENDGGLAPEGICVLTRGTILRASLMPTVKAAENKKDTVVKLPKLGGVDVTYLPEPKDALLRFYGRLRDEATPLKLINYDLDPYFDADDTGDGQVSVRA